MWIIIIIITVLVVIAGCAVFFLLPKPANIDDPAKFERTFNAAEQDTLTSVQVSSAELAAANCKDGDKCWILVDGVVYDMSVFPSWARGIHHNIKAGTDGTSHFLKSGHGVDILQKMPVVGKLEG